MPFLGSLDSYLVVWINWNGVSEILRAVPTKERRAWWRMKYRCYQPSHHKYPIYGGRGITVCERWLCSFQHFLADVGLAPSPSHSIDRIDNNGNYEPGNVRWATKSEQADNQRRTVLLTVDGVTKTFTEWVKDSPLRPSGVRRRIERGGLISWTKRQIKGTLWA